MNLTNKRIAFLGDSITEGVGVSSSDKKYVKVFKNLTGCQAFNYGISGTRIARQKGKYGLDEKFDYCFLDRVDTMIYDADIIVVFGGTNDFGHGDAELGSIDSRDEFTFYGALHSLANRLIARYPDALIVFMTPLHRTTENDLVNEVGLPRKALISYVTAIRQVCEYYSFPVLDLYANSGMQPNVPTIREHFMPDGLHPSDSGAVRIAERLAAFLEKT